MTETIFVAPHQKNIAGSSLAAVFGWYMSMCVLCSPKNAHFCPQTIVRDIATFYIRKIQPFFW
jgi:hypothetical protein